MLGSVNVIWHRGKLPFEILNFAKLCNKNCQILPQKIEKFATFCHENCQILPQKIEKFAIFGHKNYQILQINFINHRTLFRPRRPGILHWSKDGHKKSFRCISERKVIKNITLRTSQHQQHLGRCTCSLCKRSTMGNF